MDHITPIILGSEKLGAQEPWNFPAKSSGVGCHFLLQGIFPTQGLNPGLPHCKQTLLLSEPPGKLGFSDSSVGRESTCSAGDPSSIPGLGRCAGEGIGYPLQYSWASLVAQLVKNLLAMWETWVQSLGWEDLLEKGRVTHSSILAWRIPWTTVHGLTKSRT